MRGCYVQWQGGLKPQLREFRVFSYGCGSPRPDWKPDAKADAELSVCDTGGGFDIGIREKLFDLFFSTRFAGRG